MKKMIAALLALMMALLCAVSVAEEPAETPATDAQKMFDSIWISGSATVDASYMDGIWEVLVSTDYGATTWNYLCLYDEEQQALVSMDSEANVKSIISIDLEGAETAREDVDTEAKAVFTLNENGRLVWKDEKEDAGAGMEFEKIGRFTGSYACGEYLLYCIWVDSEPAEGRDYTGYRISIQIMDENGKTEWIYEPVYDSETNTLSTPYGSKEFQPAGSDDYEIIYDDGPATFTLDEEHNLYWNDEVDHTGDDLVFVETNG